MARRRFFVSEIRGGEAVLEGEEARHLTQVLRVEAGQVYEISDNDSLYLAEVDTARKQLVVFRVLELLPPPEPGPSVELYLALIKFDALELAIEKATELGVTAIRLVDADRTEHGLEKAVGKRMPRWKRIALEASQQSRRAQLPQIYEPVRLRDALSAEAEVRLFLDEERTGTPLLNAVRKTASTALLIGPEGGWTASEREAASQAGWTNVSLGPNILRAETAVLATLAVVVSVLQP
jgi:16S rRNA (uracil1498-N3)-methyltransferase